MYSSITTGAVHGIDSYLIQVETDISDGLPSFNMVGFMSGEVREAGERVRVALRNLGIHLPPRRITVNLSPAGIPKRGIVIDIPVCVGLLICLGYIKEEAADGVLVAGEVGLNGEIRPVKGILPMVVEAKERGITTCLVPRGNLAEGALVHGIRVVGVRSLAELVNYLRRDPEERDLFLPPMEVDAKDLLTRHSEKDHADLADIHGQSQAKKVLEIAAAGFHNVLMVGPPGKEYAGKMPSRDHAAAHAGGGPRSHQDLQCGGKAAGRGGSYHGETFYRASPLRDKGCTHRGRKHTCPGPDLPGAYGFWTSFPSTRPRS